jgi:PEP-CTERM motif
MKKLLAATLLLGSVWLAPAQAADVPAALIVNAGGLEWAWASPCSPVAPSCGTPLIMHDGWNIAGAAQFAASFSGFADLTAQFGSKCASAYFNSGYSHCDIGDAAIGAIWNAPAAWNGQFQQDSHDEAFVYRGSVRVPEPATTALLALGLLLLAGVARRRQLS